MGWIFWAYLTCLTIGGVWLAAQLFLTGDLEGDALDSEVVSPFKPVVLATTLALFGAIGTVLSWQGWFSPATELALSTGSGVAGGWLIYKALQFLVRSQANATQRIDDFVGLLGELTVTCSDKATGEVYFTGPGGVVHQYSARPNLDGQVLEKGTKVIIRRISGNIAYVDPL